MTKSGASAVLCSVWYIIKKKGPRKDFCKWKLQKGIGIPPVIKSCDKRFVVFKLKVGLQTKKQIKLCLYYRQDTQVN